MVVCRRINDLWSVVQGGIEVLAGASIAGGGGTAGAVSCPVTFGGGCAVAVASVAAGSIVASHGVLVAIKGTVHFCSSLDTGSGGFKGGGSGDSGGGFRKVTIEGTSNRGKPTQYWQDEVDGAHYASEYFDDDVTLHPPQNGDTADIRLNSSGRKIDVFRPDSSTSLQKIKQRVEEKLSRQADFVILDSRKSQHGMDELELLPSRISGNGYDPNRLIILPKDYPTQTVNAPPGIVIQQR